MDANSKQLNARPPPTHHHLLSTSAAVHGRKRDHCPESEPGSAVVTESRSVAEMWALGLLPFLVFLRVTEYLRKLSK